MKQLSDWLTALSISLAMLGLSLSGYIWSLFVRGSSAPFGIDLIEPLWGMYVLDWLMFIFLSFFVIFPIIVVFIESKSLPGLIPALPVAVFNIFTMFLWWSMEFGDTNVFFTIFMIALAAILNLVIAISFVVNRPDRS
jgi:hypothetical protein